MSEGRLTTPRCFGAGWDTGREQSHAPPARRRRAPRPAPEVALVPHGPRRSCGEPTPRRLRGTRGPRADAGPASQAVARLYRSQILQVNMRWKALAEIYKMHSFAPFSKLNFRLKIAQKIANCLPNFVKDIKSCQNFPRIRRFSCRF